MALMTPWNVNRPTFSLGTPEEHNSEVFLSGVLSRVSVLRVCVCVCWHTHARKPETAYGFVTHKKTRLVDTDTLVVLIRNTHSMLLLTYLLTNLTFKKMIEWQNYEKDCSSEPF